MDENENQQQQPPVEQEAPTVEEAPAVEETKRDPSTAVSVDEVLTSEEQKERINFLVEHPDERTAHDPVPSDGDPV